MHGGQALHAPVFQEIAVKNLDNPPLSYDALKTVSLLTADSHKQNLYALSAINRFNQNQVLENLHILGGNLTVLCSLQGTPHGLALDRPSVLLIEDVGEPYYRIERAFTQLLQSIHTSNLKAVVLGDFYQCPQKNVPQTIAEIVTEHLEALNIPLYQCDWFGHGAVNRPFWIGQKGKITGTQLIIG